MKIGRFRVDAIVDGETRRPLPVLYPDATPDELAAAAEWVDPVSAEIVMTIGSLLVRDGTRTILIDCGVGPDPTGSFRGGVLRSTLELAGVSREEITDVIFTHLHLDHIGWATQDGRPYFPNATYRCDERDWKHFVSPDYEIEPWELASSHPELDAARVRLAPLAGNVHFWSGDAQILPGITAIDAAGHTPGTTALLLESEGERGVILGDIVHSVPELLNGWRFAVHHEPTRAVEAISRLRTFLADEEIPCTAAHLLGMAWGRVREESGHFRWDQLEPVRRKASVHA